MDLEPQNEEDVPFGLDTSNPLSEIDLLVSKNISAKQEKKRVEEEKKSKRHRHSSKRSKKDLTGFKITKNELDKLMSEDMPVPEVIEIPDTPVDEIFDEAEDEGDLDQIFKDFRKMFKRYQ